MPSRSVTAVAMVMLLTGHVAARTRNDCFDAPRLAGSLRSCAAVVSLQASSSSRALDPKNAFVESLRQFLEAIAGQYGDEGVRVLAAIDAMEMALADWDRTIKADEAAAASQGQTADLHATLGLIYLDRRRVDDAIREFASAIRIDPGRADIHTFRGFAYSLIDKPAEAAQEFAEATALAPGDPTAAYRLAQQLRNNGELERAAEAGKRFRESRQAALAQASGGSAASPFIRVDLLRQVAGVAPIFPPALYADGFAALKQGRYGAAVASFREAAAVDPLTRAGPAREQTVAAAAALRQGQLTPALARLRAAAESAPTDAETHRVLGMAYWADEQYENSIEQFRAAIRARPGDERSSVALGDVLVAASRLADAEQAFSAAIESVPRSGQAHYNLGRLYDFQQRSADAARAFQAAARLNPVVGLDYLYQSLARVCLAQPDLDQAVDAATRRVEISPNNADAHRALGEMHLQQGRHDEAMTELLAALLINPRSGASFLGIAQVHLRTGRFAEAVEASRRALEIDPDLNAARYALATALVRTGQTEEGAREIERFQQLQAETLAREQRDWDLKMIKQEASVSLAKEDYAAAIPALQKVVSYEPDAATSYLNLGLVFKKLGRYPEAIDSLTKARDLKAGPEVYRLLAEAYESSGQREESQANRATYERMKEERLRKTGWAR
jgi:tetratricopeptide (TPR) repeat protein